MNAPHNVRKPGDLDLEFGESGLAPYPAGTSGGRAGLLGDGKIISATSDSATPAITVVRHLENGSLDTSFGEQGSLTVDMPDGEVPGSTKALVMPDDSTLVYGTLRQPGGHHRSIVFRISPSGEFDPGFGEDGYCIIDIGDDHGNHISDMIALSDGKVGILSTAARPDGFFGAYIVRLVDGRFDPTFGESGAGYIQLREGIYYALAEAAGHRFLVTHESEQNRGKCMVMQFLENGEPDYMFGTTGYFYLALPNNGKAELHKLIVQPDGKILFIGEANVGFGTHTLIARLTPDGWLDPEFNGGEIKIMVFQGYESSANAVALQPDGKIVVAGDTFVAPKDLILMRMDPDGKMDMTFGTNGQVISDMGGEESSPALMIQDDGKLLISSSRSGTSSDYSVLLARYLG